MKKHMISLGVFFLFVALFASCKKDKESTDSTVEQITAQDIVATNDLTEIADAEIDEAVPNNFTGGANDRGGCAVITSAQPAGTWPNVFTIDYGTGCTQPGGLVFKGKIIVAQSNKMTVAGATRVVTYDNFYIESAQITGTRTLTNTGLNAAGQPVWTKVGTETVVFPDGSQATRDIDHVRTMTEGYSTPNVRADNVWSIVVNDSGTNRDGNDFTAKTTTPLTRKFTCPWIISGVIELTVEDRTRSLDFGDGTCENDATLVRADGSTRDVKIRRRWWRG